VDPYDDVPQYVEYLRSICEDRRMLPAMVKNAQALVLERHTWRRFLEDLRAVPAYASRHAAVAVRETSQVEKIGVDDSDLPTPIAKAVLYDPNACSVKQEEP
jgi:hypothetical protein